MTRCVISYLLKTLSGPPLTEFSGSVHVISLMSGWLILVIIYKLKVLSVKHCALKYSNFGKFHEDLIFTKLRTCKVS